MVGIIYTRDNFMLKMKLCSLLILFGAATATSTQAQTNTDPIYQFAEYLNELSDRRRLNSVFNNQQSPFYGAQVNHVNVGRGNLTFLRRDLVRLGRLPLVFGRVYDSSESGSKDFGPGWKLAPIESVDVSETGTVRYIDSTGSIHVFVRTDEGYSLEKPFYSDIVDVQLTEDFTVNIRTRNQWEKRFNADGNLYEIIDNNGNMIRLSYSSTEALIEMQSGTRKIQIRRTPSGKIREISDDLGRSVGYEYDSHGRLRSVKDLGGNKWLYNYKSSGQIEKIVDPNGNVALRAKYSKNKVDELAIRSTQYSYEYKNRKTIVTDSSNNSSTFFQSNSGLTNRVVNPLGRTTSVTFDDLNRVIKLKKEGKLLASFDYENGHLIRTTRYSPDGEKQTNYSYDWEKNLLVAAGDEGTLIIDYDDRGNLISKSIDDRTIRYRYNLQGDLIGTERQGELFEFDVSSSGSNL